MALNAYLQQVSSLLHDTSNKIFSTATLTLYINSARNQVAAATQCIRQLTIVNLVTAQETYPLSAANVNSGGIGAAIALLSIAVPWGTYKPVLDRYTFSQFQANFRLFSGTVSGFPECYAMQGTGSMGTIYFFPIPTQTFASEWDVIYLPQPLATDTDPEAISYPFTDAIQYYAAWLALLNSQRYQEAQSQFQAYKMFMAAARAGVDPNFTPTMYPGVAGDWSGGRP